MRIQAWAATVSELAGTSAGAEAGVLGVSESVPVGELEDE